MSTRRVVSNSILALLARMFNVGIQIFSLPVLLMVYGKSNYGLIAIALSLNTFLAIMQLGIPTSIPRFVAQWLSTGQMGALVAAMRTVASFYYCVALLNSLLFLGVSLFWLEIFRVSPEQVSTLRNLLLVTALNSLISIPATMLDQMLAGAQELGFSSLLQMLSSALSGALVGLVYWQPEFLTLTQYYALRCALTFVLMPFGLMRWRRHCGIQVFIPGWHIRAVQPLVKYSLSMFLFAIFIIIARRFYPIILAMRTKGDAGAAVADFQVMDYFTIFLSTISASFMAALVPHLSGATAKGDAGILRRSIVRGTRIVWGLGALIGFGMIMLAQEGLSIYVGKDFLHLRNWLILYLSASLYYIYNVVLSSAILSSDNLAPLAWATGLGCCVSLVICWCFAPQLGAGGAILGFVGYVVSHFLVTHFWYFPKYFQINPFEQIFRVLLPPALAGTVMLLAGRWLISSLPSTNPWAHVAVGCTSGTAIYGTIIMAFYISPMELRDLIKGRAP